MQNDDLSHTYTDDTINKLLGLAILVLVRVRMERLWATDITSLPILEST